MICDKDCSWIDYDFERDTSGCIVRLKTYVCSKYNVDLGSTLNKCTKCLDADKSRNSYNKNNRRFK